MPNLTSDHIKELSSVSLEGSIVIVQRGESRGAYELAELLTHGMKGVIWRGRDDLGNSVAIKFIPLTEYADISLTDEMTEASKLGTGYFAAIRFFGDAKLQATEVINRYKCVITEWIDAVPLDKFLEELPFTVEDFLILSEKLFSALAILRDAKLCHDDLHPGNVLLHKSRDPLTKELILTLKVIDTGTIKRIDTRDRLLATLREKVSDLQSVGAAEEDVKPLKDLLYWKTPDDHLRVVECLLLASNALVKAYSKLEFWERRFIDDLKTFLDRLIDEDLGRRLDEPSQVVTELRALAGSSRRQDYEATTKLSSPFDYISAEMIRNDEEFAELFSKECPWLEECKALEPLYIYGPRGCGKSSVLRWLSFKTIAADPSRCHIPDLREVGVYISCSVELRSRFWLLTDAMIEELQVPIIRFFNLLLLEGLFDTLEAMVKLEGGHSFGLTESDQHGFSSWAISRMNPRGDKIQLRLQGQGYFSYLKNLVRKLRWDTWAKIQRAEAETDLPDPSLVIDVCRVLSEFFPYFSGRHITFLIDDYSNQRIPASLQRKLNQTISFAKQGTPIFKVSSEYHGVDLEGIQEGREVVEINVGGKYASLSESGSEFLIDIVDIRLRKAGFEKKVTDLLGKSDYYNGKMANALARESTEKPFYYHGIETVHWLCSGDVALALDLIRRIFERGSVNKSTKGPVSKQDQDSAIQQFSHDEIRRIKYIVPYGDKMYDIVCYLGSLARAFVMAKKSRRKDKYGDPVCKTHIDIRTLALREFEEESSKLVGLYGLLTSRAILLSLETSRSRLSGATERLQMKRIYFPAFKAPLKRDTAIKLDSADEIKSLLSNPRTFAERELEKSSIDKKQLRLALEAAKVRPRE
jgi:hypothetical protein